MNRRTPWWARAVDKLTLFDGAIALLVVIMAIGLRGMTAAFAWLVVLLGGAAAPRWKAPTEMRDRS